MPQPLSTSPKLTSWKCLRISLMMNSLVSQGCTRVNGSRLITASSNRINGNPKVLFRAWFGKKGNDTLQLYDGTPGYYNSEFHESYKSCQPSNRNQGFDIYRQGFSHNYKSKNIWKKYIDHPKQCISHRNTHYQLHSLILICFVSVCLLCFIFGLTYTHIKVY